MLLDLLSKRYSCRDFSKKPIPENVIKYMLECGRLSASGGNEQPWKFGVITDTDTIRKIAEAASVNYSQKWIENAPLLIVLCTQLFDGIDETIVMNRFPSLKEKLKAMDYNLFAAINMEEHQTKIPGEHMVLAALEHGIYTRLGFPVLIARWLARSSEYKGILCQISLLSATLNKQKNQQ